MHSVVTMGDEILRLSSMFLMLLEHLLYIWILLKTILR